MTNLNAVFQFGVDNGYLADNPFKGISPLKESRTIPDPLSREEFIRLIDACRNQQAKIYGVFLFILAFALVSCVHLDGRT